QHDPYALTGFDGRFVINSLLGVHFVNDALGFAVGTAVRTNPQTAIASSVVLRTDDGGASWSAQESGTTNSLYSIDCASALSCIAVGNGIVVRTDDGGASWSAH